VPDLHLAPHCGIREQIKVALIVAILEERPLPPIATLGDVVRNPREDEAKEAGHVTQK